MTGPRRLYLAGPDVFLPDAAAQGDAKKSLCAAHGFVGLFPFDAEAAPSDGLSRAIYAANLALIATADGAIFNLTPFRGPSADVGTVFELGVFIGLDKPVFAYSNVTDDLFARIRPTTRLQRDGADGPWRDADGMGVENFGNADNLMIDEALARQGRTFHRHQAADGDRFTDLSGFEACLREAGRHFSR